MNYRDPEAVTGEGCSVCVMAWGTERAAREECLHARCWGPDEQFGRDRGPGELRAARYREPAGDRMERLSTARDGRIGGIDR